LTSLDRHFRFSGTPPTHGTLARYIAHKASFLHKIPEGMSYATAALVEPISVALGGIQRSELKFGQPVMICGAGPIGLNALAIAKASGAYPILVTDIAPEKLIRAKQMGADMTLCCDISWDGLEIASRIKKLFSTIEPELLPQIALECTGAQSSFYGAGYGQFCRHYGPHCLTNERTVSSWINSFTSRRGPYGNW
jgi:L-iditol 2-dehydrogenase